MKPPAPGPVRVLSATHDTNAAAMHASTAFPPSASTAAPASAVSGWPAATAPLLPARGAARNPAAGRGDRLDGLARVRRGRRPPVGAGGALVEPDLRRGLGRDRPLGRLPVRARCRARAARDVGAPGSEAVAFCPVCRADPRSEPARLPPARPAARRLWDRALARPLRPARARLVAR